jgi:hypothetical protein
VAAHRSVLLTAVLALLVSACASEAGAPSDDGEEQEASSELGTMDDPPGEMLDMEGMPEDVPQLPPVFGYHDGGQVLFVHPEASDEETAELLTGMMGSPVIAVPALADAPADAIGELFAFTNGVQPEDTPAGPFGFQPDVFDSVPGGDDYSPLRRLVTVTWQAEADAQVLTSADQIEEATEAGEVTLERTSTVINAPMLSWPDGQR